MSSDLSPLPILVVDDHHDTADAVTRLLRKCGYDAVAAYGGEQAIAFLERQEPAAVVLDLWMPRTDGRAVLRHIAADARMQDVPVIVYSADYSEDMYRQATALGARDYLVKGTIGWQELCDRITRHLQPPGVPA